jgi:hypothetical protein
MARVLQDLLPRARLDDAARVEDRDGVRDRRQHSEVVRDEDDRELVLPPQPVEQAQDPRLNRHVERRRRLVGDEQLRPARERDGDGDALAHAARELVRVRVARSLGIRDADVLQQLHRPARGRTPVEAEVPPNVVRELASDGKHGMQRRHRVLEDHPHLAAADLP